MSEEFATFNVKRFQRVTVLEASGRIDSTNASRFDSELQSIMADGRHNIVLDLSGINYISSAALRAMVSAMRTCKKKRGEVRLANPSDRVTEVLSLAGLESIFPVYEDQVSAVGSF